MRSRSIFGRLWVPAPAPGEKWYLVYLFCCIPVPVPKTSWYFVLKNLLNISKEVFFLSFYLFGWSRSHLYIFSSGSTSKKAGSVTLSFTHIFKNSMISGGYFFQSAFSP